MGQPNALLAAAVSSLGEFKQMMLSYLPTSRIMTQEHLLMAAPYALQLIMLGYLDSLLTALIMDHLTSTKSRLDKELVGQGLANGLSALLGGIPGAQATIRSVLLFKEGAHTRSGAMSAGVFTLLGLVAFRNSIGLITSAVFIGVLFKAALDVFEKEFLTLYVKRRWYTSRKRNIQIAFIMYTMLLTAPGSASAPRPGHNPAHAAAIATRGASPSRVTAVGGGDQLRRMQIPNPGNRLTLGT